MPRSRNAHVLQHAAIAVLAICVVYASSPHRPDAIRPLVAVNAGCAVELYGIDNGTTLYKFDQVTGAAQAIAPLSGVHIGLISGMDFAADGTLYILGQDSDGPFADGWFKLDVVTGVVSPVAPITCEFPPCAFLTNGAPVWDHPGPAFLPHRVNGGPLGYQVVRGNGGLNLWSIDSMTPPSVTQLGFVPLLASNFGIGSHVTDDGANVYYATTDLIFRIPTAPPYTLGLATGLGLLELSSDATVAGHGNQMAIVDGIFAHSFSLPSTFLGSVRLASVSMVMPVALSNCPRGGVHVEPTRGLVTTESGGAASFTAALTYPPTADVTVNFVSSSPERGLVFPSSVTFVPQNWSVAKTITVTGQSDGILDPVDVPYTVDSTTVSSDSNYDGRDVEPVHVIHQSYQPPVIDPTPPPHDIYRGTSNTFQIATVSDPDEPAGLLSVEAGTPLDRGISVSSIVNTGGSVTATVSTSCDTVIGPHSIPLTVIDTRGSRTSATLSISVPADAPPVLYGAQTVARGSTTTFAPVNAPSPQTMSIAVTSSSFTGDISVDQDSGDVTLTDAQPTGTHQFQLQEEAICGPFPQDGPFLRASTFLVNVTSDLPGNASCTQQFYGFDSATGRLVTINRATLARTDVAPLTGLSLDTAPYFVRMDFSPGGTLYAIVRKSDASMAWVTIDPDTAVMTEIGPYTGSTRFGDLTLNPSPRAAQRGLVAETFTSEEPPQNDRLFSIDSFNPLERSFATDAVGEGNGSLPMTYGGDGSTLFLMRNDLLYSLDLLSGVLTPRSYYEPYEWRSFNYDSYIASAEYDPATGRIFLAWENSILGRLATASTELPIETAANITSLAMRMCPQAPSVTDSPRTSWRQGSPAASAVLATTNDPALAAGAITTSFMPVGITPSSFSATAGVISGTLDVGCSAPTGFQRFVLTATNANGFSSSEGVDLEVLLNTPPTVGTYADPASILAGDGTTVTPSAPPADNGTATLGVNAPGFSGGLAVDSTTGVVTVTNAGPAGTFTVTVTNSDNCGLTGTARSFTLTVDPLPTTTSLVPSANPSTYGATLTLTATVTSGATGTMLFRDGATTLGSSAIAGGIATFSTASLDAGSHSLTAVYSGDSTHAASTSSPLLQLVDPIESATTLVSSHNPSTCGLNIRFTATVSGGGSGEVTFRDGASLLATEPVSGGEASFVTAELPAGSHAITASYAGDANHVGSSSAPLTQQVNLVPTSVAIASSANPSAFGVAVTFTATVDAAASGSISFDDGGTLLTTVPVTAGVATFTTSALAIGAHPITASYGGDATHAAAAAALTQTVNAAPGKGRRRRSVGH